METEKGYPRIGQAVILLLLLFLLGVTFAVAALIALRTAGIRLPPGDPAMAATVNTASFASILLLGFLRTRRPFGEVFPLSAFRPGVLIPLILLTAGFGIISSEVDNATRALLPMPGVIARLFENLAEGGAASIMILVVVAPLTEELLFRGLFLQGFLINYSEKKAVLVSALLFAIFHANPYQLFSAFFLGILFAWLLIRTRSLWPCILAHALNNGHAWLTANIFGVRIPGYIREAGTSLQEVQFQPLWFDLLGALLFGLGLFWLVKSVEQEGGNGQTAN